MKVGTRITFFFWIQGTETAFGCSQLNAIRSIRPFLGQHPPLVNNCENGNLMFRRALFCFTLIVGFVLSTAAQSQGSGGSNRFFEVDVLNAGLPNASAEVNLDTPQSAMETFVFAAQRNDWMTAAHVLDLAEFARDEQAERGQILAEHLYEVVQGAIWLDWSALPDRPDGLDAFSSSKDPMAGEPRRSIRLAIIQLPDQPVSIRLARMKPADGEPAWVFSAQTVQNIPAMYEKFGPTWFEQELPGFLREQAFWTLAWWEVIAFPVLMLLAFFAAAAVYSLMQRLERRSLPFAAEIAGAIKIPLALLAFFATFVIVKNYVFTFSGVVNTILQPIQTTALIIAVVLIVVRIIDAVLDRMAERDMGELSDQETAEERAVYTNISAARRIVIALAIVAGTGIVLAQTNAFETLGFSILASAGFVGLLLLFAARTVLEDVMSSLQIAFAKTARIGDAVLYEGEWCYVEKINFTHLQLKTWDNRRFMAPVNHFISHPMENWSKQDARLLKPVLLQLDHRADIDALREAFQEFVKRDDDIVEKDDCKVQVIDQNASSIAVRFYIMAPDPMIAWEVHCRLREFMLKTVAKLDAESLPEAANRPTFLPREREVIVNDFSPGEAN